MNRATALYRRLTCLIGLVRRRGSRVRLARRASVGVRSRRGRAFPAEIEKPPVAYHARRRLEASSAKLKESAWLEAITEYDPVAGFSYAIVAQGGSERIARRVLKRVLDAEKENTAAGEWHKGNLSRANYSFDFGGHDSTRHAAVAADAATARSTSRARLGAAHREIRRPRSRGRTAFEIAVVLGALGRRGEQLRARRRHHDARRDRVDGRRAHRRNIDILDDLRLQDGRRASGQRLPQIAREPLARSLPPSRTLPLELPVRSYASAVAGIDFLLNGRPCASKPSPR